jgi:hypothetical protein
MKRAFLLALVILVIGVGAFLAFRTRHDSTTSADNRIPPVRLHPEVSLRFVQCAGTVAVFLLQNGTDNPIYARVYPRESWPEFRDANLQYGLHLIEYKSSPNAPVRDVGPMFDLVENFRPIMPDERVRYGVNLHAGPGEYTVKVPYMQEAEVARSLDEAWHIRPDFERVKNSWLYASSSVVTTTCQ